MNTIEISANPDVQIRPIADGLYCVIIDDFLKEPESVIEFACSNAANFRLQEFGYPGVLLNVPRGAMTRVQNFLKHQMSRQFSFLKGGIRTTTFLSMTTRQPDELAPLQRLCHTDPRNEPERRNFAALVYLFRNEDLGGTGFYRWKEQALIEEATALELEKPGGSLEFLQQHVDLYREKPRYMTGSNDIAELLLEVPARFNRFVFYSGDFPHSAHIQQPELLSTDFAKGRLTLNCFASVRPR